MKKISLTILLLSIFVTPALADDATFSRPAGGEVWGRGTMKTITYTFSAELSPQYEVALFRNEELIGYISYHNYAYPAGVYNEQWVVGKVENENGESIWAPCGGGYTIRIGYAGSGPPPLGISNPFSIVLNFLPLARLKKIFYFPLTKPIGCPECFTLDLTDLRKELIKLDETIAAGLYWQGKMVADLGQIGKGQRFAAKLQVKLEPAALTAMKRGEEFELRLFTGRGKLVHSQAVRLIAASLNNRKVDTIRKR